MSCVPALELHRIGQVSDRVPWDGPLFLLRSALEAAPSNPTLAAAVLEKLSERDAFPSLLLQALRDLRALPGSLATEHLLSTLFGDRADHQGRPLSGISLACKLQVGLGVLDAEDESIAHWGVYEQDVPMSSSSAITLPSGFFCCSL